MEATIFTVHDVEDFPLVRVRRDRIVPGFAASWAAEMDALCAGEPFVLIFPAYDLGETHEDFKARGLWLKENHDRLDRVCRLLITVEPDPEQREHLQQLLAKREKAFGVRQAVVESMEEAEALARALKE